MKQPHQKSQTTSPKPSMGTAATTLCCIIIATAFIYFSFVQADREQLNHDVAIANARAQLAELNAQEAVRKSGEK
ncbi:hypothetical protein I2F27_06685 [Acinetobacter sp. B5B]|uniref:hypothetical protein n=1 Tax=Acinetobacter TaxID=469 RepID=UPI0018A2E860|nr:MULTISPECIES: hypothetical protein [Acinetobacter]MBF7683011.1 hypothetical protein [Acinetobacter baretiae]MBF7696166.1 hypothetical protein [Acinetobacter rathckeae]